ncbi:MAG TPA: histidine phosphatase family protein, partial [Lamprocystis sp. (in: g-proteobacteria)]|nr:histidine phosphatase family protein [Lamprocystis sp. (in: g-proteobacteria)]
MDERTVICVTRHGETDWNISGILQGWIDVPLNDTGRRQALELAESLGGYGFLR